MARAKIGTSKYEAKTLKASGSQKLKYYCQICSKQCRDSNGFKNLLQSKSHLGRISNLQSSGESNSIVSSYSHKFQTDFLNLLLLVNHGTKSINANRFYQEYIRQLTQTDESGENGEMDSEGFNLETGLIDSQEIQRLKNKEDEEYLRANNEINDRLIQKQIKREQELEIK
ncbi:hypothetical protein CANMA_001409 [Candida margitis]|uniref:uncharacterized protein n=1 Tax=Candida margitis TaxID=1775924 RepID=UPI0022276448|nr:uncharacterized protein CANMA_001409 [Candida margitis]KAI5969559.1 hypothetical protein CANMA_001409 [Candida margitis]